MSTSVRFGARRRLGRVGIVGAAVLGALAIVVPAQAGTPTSASPGTTVAPAAVRQADLRMHARPATGPLPKTGQRKHAVSTRAAAVAAPAAGTPVASSQYPSVVGIVEQWIDHFENGNPVYYQGVCTGTILNSHAVLTTAGCEFGLPGESTVVVAGSSDLTDNTTGYAIAVATTWTDPNFNAAALNAGTTTVPTGDAGVLVLAWDLPSQYTPMSQENQPPAAGSQTTMVGYNLTPGSNSIPLQAQTLQYQPTATCAALTGFDASGMSCSSGTNGAVVPDVCDGANGAPLIDSSGEVSGIADWGSECAAGNQYVVSENTAPFATDAYDFTNGPLVARNQDFSGDGHSDLLLRGGSGALVEYAGSGFVNDGHGGFAGQFQIGTGWNGFSKLLRAQSWYDGYDAVLAVTPNGNLYEYDQDPVNTGYTKPTGKLIGTGWNVFTQIVEVQNWYGINTGPALLGVTAGGDLRIYSNDGNGNWLDGGGTTIGTGWNVFDTLLSVRGYNADWMPELIGRTPSGDLLLYSGDGYGGWATGSGQQIGSGWNVFTRIIAPGDWSGDNNTDVLGVLPNGDLRMFTGNGNHGWLDPSGQTVGTGFQIATALF